MGSWTANKDLGAAEGKVEEAGSTARTAWVMREGDGRGREWEES